MTDVARANALALAGAGVDGCGDGDAGAERDGVFVELQDHGLAKQHRTNPQLVEIARQIGAPLLATNDSHYTKREHAVAHDALLCVQTGASLTDEKRFKWNEAQLEHLPGTPIMLRVSYRPAPEYPPGYTPPDMSAASARSIAKSSRSGLGSGDRFG